ncbi:MAG TPA: Lrp/AsnC family transcriptional regulator [Novosphingobium sp.]
MKHIKLDQLDRKILALLQTDATRSLVEISEQVGLSPSPCWKRIRRLEDEGVIEKRVALLNRQALQLGVTVIVAIRAGRHNEEWFRQFSEGVIRIPEVIEFYRMSGDVDYILKVVARDIEDYDRIYRELTKVTELRDISSTFAMQELKSTTVLPLRI